jgi:hypothetical protein
MWVCYSVFGKYQESLYPRVVSVHHYRSVRLNPPSSRCLDLRGCCHSPAALSQTIVFPLNYYSEGKQGVSNSGIGLLAIYLCRDTVVFRETGFLT